LAKKNHEYDPHLPDAGFLRGDGWGFENNTMGTSTASCRSLVVALYRKSVSASTGKKKGLDNWIKNTQSPE
jgi:hypothetical protein